MVDGGMSQNVSSNFEHLRLVESLDVHLIELKGITARHHGSTDERTLFCLVKLDGEEVFYSSAASHSQNLFFGDHFYKEVPKSFNQLSFYLLDQYPGRVARQLGRVTFRKKDILKHSGSEAWYRIEPLVNRNCDVNGKVCIEVLHDKRAVESGFVNNVKIRVLDYCDLTCVSGRNSDLFALVYLQQSADEICETKKIRIRRTSRPVTNSISNPTVISSSTSSSSSTSAEWASFDLNDNQVRTVLRQSQSSTDDSAGGADNSDSDYPQIRVSIWNDMGLVTSYFHGEVRINLNDYWKRSKSGNEAWYYLKPRSKVTSQREAAGRTSSSTSGYTDLGSLRLRINYTVDHVLSALYYSELWTNLLDSLKVQPWRCSVLGVLDVLPNTDLELAARYLVKVFLHSEQIKQLVRALCVDQINKCQDVNTLFRGNTLASKCVSELMKFVGHQYLLSSLKPCLDKIFAEKKNCEIDPQRITNDNVDENMQNLIVYTEFALSRILDSNHRCPQLLKDVFRLLRECTERHFPHQLEVQWLVLSSFLIHRFFAAALMSPKLFGLQKDNPSPNVARTLALMSKIIQRLSNAVVVGKGLVEKEAYMTPILERFTDQRHTFAFVKFLDRISCTNGDSSISGESITMLKEGTLKERKLKGTTCFKVRLRPSLPRYCCLTENEFYWCKEKGGTPLGRINLLDLTTIQFAEEEFQSKLVFQLATETSSVYLEAISLIELRDWVYALRKAGRRQRLTQHHISDNAQMYDIVIENHLEAIHMIFLQHIEIIRMWRDCCNNGTICLPALPDSVKSDPQIRAGFSESLHKILCCAFTLEQNHREALSKHLSQCKYGSKDMPIGDDNYLLLKSRMRNFAFLNQAAAVVSSSSNSSGASIFNAVQPSVSSAGAVAAELHVTLTDDDDH